MANGSGLSSPRGLGGMLWQARKRAGLTARGLGLLIGSSGQHVHFLEYGDYRPTESCAARLITALPLTAWECAVLEAFASPDRQLRSGKPRRVAVR